MHGAKFSRCAIARLLLCRLVRTARTVQDYVPLAGNYRTHAGMAGVGHLDPNDGVSNMANGFAQVCRGARLGAKRCAWREESIRS